jgi:hypothetical protein
MEVRKLHEVNMCYLLLNFPKIYGLTLFVVYYYDMSCIATIRTIDMEVFFNKI